MLFAWAQYFSVTCQTEYTPVKYEHWTHCRYTLYGQRRMEISRWKKFGKIYSAEWFEVVLCTKMLPLDLRRVVSVHCACALYIWYTYMAYDGIMFRAILYSNHCHSITLVDWSCKLHWPLKQCGLYSNPFCCEVNTIFAILIMLTDTFVRDAPMPAHIELSIRRIYAVALPFNSSIAFLNN